MRIILTRIQAGGTDEVQKPGAASLRQCKSLSSAKSQASAAPVAILKCGISILPEPTRSAIIFILIGKKGNKLSETLEAAFFYGDYSALHEFWTFCDEDEQDFDIETTE